MTGWGLFFLGLLGGLALARRTCTETTSGYSINWSAVYDSDTWTGPAT